MGRDLNVVLALLKRNVEGPDLGFGGEWKIAHGARRHLSTVYRYVEPGHRIAVSGEFELHRDRAPVGTAFVARIGDAEFGRRAIGEIGELEAGKPSFADRCTGVGEIEGALDDIGAIEVLLQLRRGDQLAGLIPDILVAGD